MINLQGTTHSLELLTTAAQSLDWDASYVDYSDTDGVPSSASGNIATATTTTILAAPGSGLVRQVKWLSFRNRGAALQTVTVKKDISGTDRFLTADIPLMPGEYVQYTSNRGFVTYDNTGREKTSLGNQVIALTGITTVVLASDVTNNNATLNTIQDVTGLSFAVTAGQTYYFYAEIAYTAAATTTGSRWSVSGPGSPTALRYSSTYSLTATTQTTNHGLAAYDLPAASNATSAATGANTAIVQGFITPSANGTVTIRFASEVASSAIVAKAGSILQWIRTL
jgi:hypothetical protein